MKMNIFNNRTYDIIDDIKIKLSSGNRTKTESFEVMAGKYKLNFEIGEYGIIGRG